jgi:hypothetical protein
LVLFAATVVVAGFGCIVDTLVLLGLITCYF